MAPSAGFGFVALGLLIQLAVYCVIGLVVWKFYQMISRIVEDVSAIKELLGRRAGEPGLDLGIPPDPLV